MYESAEYLTKMNFTNNFREFNIGNSALNLKVKIVIDDKINGVVL